MSGFHKLVITVLWSYFKELPTENVLYRNSKGFEKILSLET